jgi:hypothetical protein
MGERRIPTRERVGRSGYIPLCVGVLGFAHESRQRLVTGLRTVAMSPSVGHHLRVVQQRH